MSSVLQRLLHNLNLHSPTHHICILHLPVNYADFPPAQPLGQHGWGGWPKLVHDSVIPWGDFPYTTKNGILL